MGRHRVQQARSPVRTAVNTSAISGAMLWLAFSAAGTASAKTHHGADAPGNPFGGFPVSAPTATAGVVTSSTTSIVRHSTGTSPGTGGTTPGSGASTALVNGQPTLPGVVTSSTTSIVRHSTGTSTPPVAGSVASSGLTTGGPGAGSQPSITSRGATSTPGVTAIQNAKPAQTGAGAAASVMGTKPPRG
jgi:hypothetical protein